MRAQVVGQGEPQLEPRSSRRPPRRPVRPDRRRAENQDSSLILRQPQLATEQSIPLETTPRIRRCSIRNSPGSTAPIGANGTISPTRIQARNHLDRSGPPASTTTRRILSAFAIAAIREREPALHRAPFADLSTPSTTRPSASSLLRARQPPHDRWAVSRRVSSRTTTVERALPRLLKPRSQCPCALSVACPRPPMAQKCPRNLTSFSIITLRSAMPCA